MYPWEYCFYVIYSRWFRMVYFIYFHCCLVFHYMNLLKFTFSSLINRHFLFLLAAMFCFVLFCFGIYITVLISNILLDTCLGVKLINYVELLLSVFQVLPKSHTVFAAFIVSKHIRESYHSIYPCQHWILAHYLFYQLNGFHLSFLIICSVSICSLRIQISSTVNCLNKSFTHFSTETLTFFVIGL